MLLIYQQFILCISRECKFSVDCVARVSFTKASILERGCRNPRQDAEGGMDGFPCHRAQRFPVAFSIALCTACSAEALKSSTHKWVTQGESERLFCFVPSQLGGVMQIHRTELLRRAQPGFMVEITAADPQ